MHDFSAVSWKRETLSPVFGGDHLKNSSEFSEGSLSIRHQSIATRKRRDFSDPRPVVLAI